MSGISTSDSWIKHCQIGLWSVKDFHKEFLNALTLPSISLLDLPLYWKVSLTVVEAAPMAEMFIGKLAAQFGLNPHMLRYYENLNRTTREWHSR